MMQSGEEAGLRTLVADFERHYGAPGPNGLLAVVAPGRSEIAGNHTDHEGGHVIAGAVDRYVRGVFAPAAGLRARVRSRGYEPFELDLGELVPQPQERGTSAALVRGLAAAFAERGIEPRGFDCCVESEVPAGSGLSSSAAFELEIAQAMNHLWAAGRLDALTLARMSQAAERDFFGKPCGLMDQAAVAVGGLSHMDFRDPEAPQVQGIDLDLEREGYALVLVAVGADHAANTADYAAVPQEMRAVALELGAPTGRLCEVREEDLLGHAAALRTSVGDRALLRALHYFREERLVEARARALAQHDMPTFLECTNLSGASSAMYLQNVSIAGAREQPAMVALAVAQELLGNRGAARIHGGGFGGTIQAFVPWEGAREFCRGMDGVLGRGSAQSYRIDHEGARARWL